MSPLLAADLAVTLPNEGSAAVKLFLLVTLLSFSSAILVSCTSFTRIVVVLSFMRQALGLQQSPPNQVLLALALSMTFFVMAPTASKVHADALGPYLDGAIPAETAMARAEIPVRDFLLRHARESDVRLFFEASGRPRPDRGDPIPLTVAIPAFMISELTAAFRMGLTIYVPFLVIDLLVSSLLMSLGMMMVPPSLVALPLKVAVFLLADGWALLVKSLIGSYA